MCTKNITYFITLFLQIVTLATTITCLVSSNWVHCLIGNGSYYSLGLFKLCVGSICVDPLSNNLIPSDKAVILRVVAAFFILGAIVNFVSILVLLYAHCTAKVRAYIAVLIINFFDMVFIGIGIIVFPKFYNYDPNMIKPQWGVILAMITI
eukprot:Pgem_evm1s14935